MQLSVWYTVFLFIIHKVLSSTDILQDNYNSPILISESIRLYQYDEYNYQLHDINSLIVLTSVVLASMYLNLISLTIVLIWPSLAAFNSCLHSSFYM